MSRLGDAVRRLQADPQSHPLTCSGGGGPGDHQTVLYVDSESKGEVVLRCYTCGYEQHVRDDSPLADILLAVPRSALPKEDLNT